jgi:hypothetical protein
MSSEHLSLIERHGNPGSGYTPVVIREGWQVAYLDFMPQFRPEAIDRLERHTSTDEIFVLFHGGAALVAAVESPGGLQLEVLPMEAGVVYNVPAARWHTIAMTPEDVVLIVEKNHTHLHDVEFRSLTDAERSALQAMLGPAPTA